MSLSLDESLEILDMRPAVFSGFFSQRLVMFPDIRQSDGSSLTGCS
jgi:hypothetical protein